MKFFYILVLTPIVFGCDDEWNKVSQLQDFTEELLNLDVNNAAQYVYINFEGHTNIPPERHVLIDNQAFQIPTISKLLQLYDNYSQFACMWAEEDSLLDSFMDTYVMQHTMQFLADKGLVGRDPKEQKALLEKIWFTMYSRDGGSCGFQHVFLGEWKKGKMSGMHNWIFFDYKKAMKEAEYLDYFSILELEGMSKGAILELRYKWANVMKPVSSMFVGTSPELEMALYTVCFLVHPNEECQVRMAGKDFSIRTFSYPPRSKNKIIGSAYPEIQHRFTPFHLLRGNTHILFY